jgi:metallophosphoesterase (TIGR00282 family)
LKILAIGDIIGKPGRDAVKKLLPELRREYDIDMVVANGENLAGGIGLTPATADELLCAGVDVITSGNHIWAQKDIIPCMDGRIPVLRPLNYPPGVPGRGYLTQGNVVVVNLIGRTFMGNYDCPFRAMDKLLSELPPEIKIILIDFHAEATSEKMAMGRYLDGHVSALWGTHTHVATADAQIFPGAMAYITDVGMVGPLNSVIGDDSEAVIHRFLSLIPQRLSVAEDRRIAFNAILVEVNPITGKASRIERLYREVD